MIARFYRPPPAAALTGNWRHRWRRWVAQWRRDWRHAAVRDEAALFRDGAERFTQHCRHCRDETAHEGVGEVGLGWYAQICRCRRCGQHSVKIWTCW